MTNKNLYKIARKVRKDILKISNLAKSSHVGSCLSIVDILVALYFSIFENKAKKNFEFILSKGHACLALYCILYNLKIISKKLLNSYGTNNTLLMQHVSHKVPEIKVSTGSLGHGLPIGAGIALSSKLKNTKKTIYVLISDGELNEGSTWEALMFASHHKLSNLVVIVDYNKIQSLDLVEKTLKIEPLSNKFKSFGCDVKIIEGHNFSKILSVLKQKNKKKPLIIIANTIKGKGVSFMENKVSWHYKSPNDVELFKALKELD